MLDGFWWSGVLGFAKGAQPNLRYYDGDEGSLQFAFIPQEEAIKMKHFPYTIAIIIGGVSLSTTAAAFPVVYSDEAVFRAAAGPSTTYGFETHGVVEGAELAFSSPLSASQLDNNFDLAYTNFNGFSVFDNGAAQGVADGIHYLFTHSVGIASNYTLTFSNFGDSNANITAFGLTITDFASNITDLATITYNTGSLTGTLLSIIGGQPDYTQNFVGLTVDSGDALSTITLTINDNLSGFQDFDEVIYSQATAVPEPGTFVFLGFSVLGFARRRNKHVS